MSEKKIAEQSNGSKSEARVKAAPAATTPEESAEKAKVYNCLRDSDERTKRAAEAERVVLQQPGGGARFGDNATIGEMLPILFYNEYEHTQLTLAEEALHSIADELFILAVAMDPNGNSGVDEFFYRTVMRVRGRASVAAELSERMRKAQKAEVAS